MKTIGSIESFTGGLFAHKITNIPGCSKFYKGSIITYSNELKEKLLMSKFDEGVINANAALTMSKKGKEILNVDYCISFTGNAGPTSMENKPIGMVYIAINEVVFEKKFIGNREQVKEQAVDFAIKYLIDNKIINVD